MPHHPNLPVHRTAAEAMKCVPVFLEVVRNVKAGTASRDDAANGVQAGAVIADYGSSMLHSELIGSAAGISEDAAMAHLEDFAASDTEGGVAQAAAFPWELILPFVLAYIKQLLERRKNP